MTDAVKKPSTGLRLLKRLKQKAAEKQGIKRTTCAERLKTKAQARKAAKAAKEQDRLAQIEARKNKASSVKGTKRKSSQQKPRIASTQESRRAKSAKMTEIGFGKSKCRQSRWQRKQKLKADSKRKKHLLLLQQNWLKTKRKGRRLNKLAAQKSQSRKTRKAKRSPASES